MSVANKFRDELMKLVKESGADITISAGIVKMKFKDESTVDFTEPLVARARGKTHD